MPAVAEADFISFVNGNVRKKKGGKWVKVPLEEAFIGSDENRWKVVFNPPGAEELLKKVRLPMCSPSGASLRFECKSHEIARDRVRCAPTRVLTALQPR